VSYLLLSLLASYLLYRYREEVCRNEGRGGRKKKKKKLND
jgi:peptidoglycan/LPS O-acetylase OafA/YrhL